MVRVSRWVLVVTSRRRDRGRLQQAEGTRRNPQYVIAAVSTIERLQRRPRCRRTRKAAEGRADA